MDTIEYRTKDKSKWGDGPWQTEPDKRQWRDPETRLACLIVRPHGALCGYVGVPKGHPAYGRPYNDVDVDVHGGLTFAGPCQDGPEERVICHRPAPGEPDDLWWLGFDCGHAMDLDPKMRSDLGKAGSHCFYETTYRTMAYVTGEVEKLARQLRQMGGSDRQPA